MSVINVMLYAVIQIPYLYFGGFDIRIGGLNETELYDLRQIPSPYKPLRSDVEMFGAWSASFVVSNASSNSNWAVTQPPLESATPYLSRIKSWGYKITFYNSYINENKGYIYAAGFAEAFLPTLMHNWILEKDSELRVLTSLGTNLPNE